MPEKPTMNDMMEAYALDAVDHAKQAMGVDLDFSPESVRKVESILATMFEARPKGFLSRLFSKGPSPELLDTFSKMYGAYVGEVLRRAGGGEWFVDTEVAPGHRVIGLRKGDGRIWPTAKVGKRLTNGSEDNVWHYFQIIREEHW
ncbi:MAG: hypothetical protein KDB94_05455 [Acidobacteria bacterium]|nr:hypothetical protein [Acidobacteriota bacterium]